MTREFTPALRTTAGASRPRPPSLWPSTRPLRSPPPSSKPARRILSCHSAPQRPFTAWPTDIQSQLSHGINLTRSDDEVRNLTLKIFDRWRGSNQLPQSSARFEQTSDNTLRIRSVGLRDLGEYSCQAYNGLGAAASSAFTLRVVGPVASTSAEEDQYMQYVVEAPRAPSRPGYQTRPPGGIYRLVKSTVVKINFKKAVTKVLPPLYVVWFHLIFFLL